jgi:hypothetical protein
MAKDFEMEFCGLCAYLLHGKDGNGDERSATVLLVNHHHAQHFPRLTVEIGSLKNDSDLKRLANNNGIIGWLDLPPDADISIEPGGSKSKSNDLKLNSPKGTEKACPNLFNKHNLAWLPDLNALGARKSLPTLLDPTPFPARIAARVLLTEGDLRCEGHAATMKVVHKYRFGESTPGALGSIGRYHLDSKADTLDIRFDVAGTKQFSLTLILPTKVMVTHLPDPTDPPDLPGHFQAFYDVLLVPGTPNPPPTYVESCGDDIEVRNEPRRPCPQAMLRLS